MTKTPSSVSKKLSASTIALLALIGASGASLMYNVYVPIDIAPVVGKTAINKSVDASLPTEKNHKIRALSSYKHLTTRPLFNPDRRPFDPAEAKKRKRPLPKLVRARPSSRQSFRLLGVLINDKTKKALIGSNSDLKGKWFTQGVTIYGWKVVAIHQDRVIMEKKGSAREIALYAKPTKR